MTSSSSYGISQVTLQFDLDRDIDAAAQDVQAAINAARLDAAAQPSLSADLFQGEPGRRADPHAGADLGDRVAAQPERSRRHAAGAAAERDRRRRPRLDAGRHPAGGAHPGRSGAARRLRPRAGGHPPGDRRRQRRRAEGRARRRAPVLHHRRQRPARRGRSLSHAGHRLSQRRAGAAARRRRGRRRAGERQGRRLVQGQAGGGHRHPAPARRQRRRRPSQRIQARAAAAAARILPVGATLTVVHDRTDTIRASIRDVQFTLVLAVGAGGAGGVHLPAHASAPPSSPAWRCRCR